MLNKNRKLLSLVLLLVFLISLCVGSLLVMSRNRITGVEASQQICDNLVRYGEIQRSECVITDYFPNYIPYMFPIGKVTRSYVKAGMEGFYISDNPSARLIQYGLYRNWLGEPTEPWIDFYFDASGTLIEIDYHD